MDLSIKILKILGVLIVIFALIDIAAAYHHDSHASNGFWDDMIFYSMINNVMYNHPGYRRSSISEEEEESAPHYSSSPVVEEEPVSVTVSEE